MPYTPASAWICLAPAIPPRIAAPWPSIFKPLPALKAAPPFEYWIMTGEFTALAASMTALAELDPITFTAGRAKLFSLAIARTV